MIAQSHRLHVDALHIFMISHTNTTPQHRRIERASVADMSAVLGEAVILGPRCKSDEAREWDRSKDAIPSLSLGSKRCVSRVFTGSHTGMTQFDYARLLALVSNNL
jgi:hypothetical protein